MIKPILAAMAAIIMTTVGVGGALAAASPAQVKVEVDGSAVQFPDAKPYIDASNGRTMVPVRFVSQKLGATVDWDSATQTVKMNKDGKQIALKIGEEKAIVDGKTITFDAKATLKDSRTFVPLRFVSEAYGAQVKWMAEQRLVTIVTKVDINHSLKLEADSTTQPAMDALVSSIKIHGNKVTGKIPNLPTGHKFYLQYKDTSDGKWGKRTNDKDFSDLKPGQTFEINYEGKGGFISFSIFQGDIGKNGVSVRIPNLDTKWSAKR